MILSTFMAPNWDNVVSQDLWKVIDVNQKIHKSYSRLLFTGQVRIHFSIRLAILHFVGLKKLSWGQSHAVLKNKELKFAESVKLTLKSQTKRQFFLVKIASSSNSNTGPILAVSNTIMLKFKWLILKVFFPRGFPTGKSYCKTYDNWIIFKHLCASKKYVIVITLI